MSNMSQSVDTSDLPIEDRIEAAAAAAYENNATSVTVALHESDKGKIGSKIDEFAVETFDETALRARLDGGNYMLIVRADRKPITRMAFNVRKPPEPTPPPPPAPSPAPQLGGIDGSNIIAVLMAQMNHATQLQVEQMRASSQQNAAMMQALIGMMKERNVERTPIDELVRLHKLLDLGKLDDDEEKPLIPPDVARELIGVLNKFADRPQSPPSPPSPPPQPPAPPDRQIARKVEHPPKPAGKSTENGDAFTEKEREAIHLVREILPVAVGYLQLAMRGEDSDDAIASTLMDMLGSAGWEIETVLETSEPGQLAEFISQQAPKLDAARLRKIEDSMRHLMETDTDGGTEPEPERPAQPETTGEDDV